MSAEEYSIKRPEHIVIGDPWYFETETGERLKKLVVDYRPEERFSTRLNIEEMEEGGMKMTNVYICFAPEKDIELYMANCREMKVFFFPQIGWPPFRKLELQTIINIYFT